MDIKLVIDVIHKPTGERRTINEYRFNPAVHQKIPGQNHRLFTPPERDTPIVLTDKDFGLPIIGQNPHLAEKVSAVEEVQVEIPVEEVSLDSMSMPELRKLAKERGIKYPNTTKKAELITLLS